MSHADDFVVCGLATNGLGSRASQVMESAQSALLKIVLGQASAVNGMRLQL